MSYKHRYSPRKIGTIVDSVHIVIGVAVTIMAVFAIFEPVKYMFLFPVIFALAAVLSAVTGWYSLIAFQRNSGKKAAGIIYLTVAVLLTVFAVISAVSIWGHN